MPVLEFLNSGITLWNRASSTGWLMRPRSAGRKQVRSLPRTWRESREKKPWKKSRDECREGPKSHDYELRLRRSRAAAFSDVAGLSRAMIALDLSMVRRDFRAATVIAFSDTSAARGWS